jgi:starch synthase
VDLLPGSGTGFVFDAASASALVRTVLRAARMRADQPAQWAALVRRAMTQDFGWDTGSAPQYLVAYRRAAVLRRT